MGGAATCRGLGDTMARHGGLKKKRSRATEPGHGPIENDAAKLEIEMRKFRKCCTPKSSFEVPPMALL